MSASHLLKDSRMLFIMYTDFVALTSLVISTTFKDPHKKTHVAVHSS